jgi:MFS family permease
MSFGSDLVSSIASPVPITITPPEDVEETPQNEEIESWVPLVLLAASQAVMVLDATVMNVSLSSVMADIGISVNTMQTALAAYTLFMASFMAAGASIVGRHTALYMLMGGLFAYGVGSAMTAAAQNFTVFFIGWCVLEGLGAVIVLPGIISLVAGIYTAPTQRATAFGILGGVGGSAAAAGPIIGGLFTTYASWRYVFVIEAILVVIIIVGLLANRAHILSKVPPPGPPTKSFDIIGTILLAISMGCLVFAALNSSAWGIMKPLDSAPFTIGPFSPVIMLFCIAIVAWFQFLEYEDLAESWGTVDVLLASEAMNGTVISALTSKMVLLFTIGSYFFLFPLYVQTVLGYDALNTGMRLLPLSISLFIASALAPRLQRHGHPRPWYRFSFVCIAIGLVGMALTADEELSDGLVVLFHSFIGAGAGLLFGTVTNVLQSAVSTDAGRARMAGVEGTAHNLGNSLGTSVVGAVTLTRLTSAFVDNVVAEGSLDPAFVINITSTAVAEGLPFVPPADAAAAFAEAYDLSEADLETVTGAYTDSMGVALLSGVLTIIFVVVFGCGCATQGLPHAKRTPLRSAARSEARAHMGRKRADRRKQSV